jgi:hypothetical protein
MQEDGERRDAQFDPHNKQPANAKRIRMSWIVIVLIFTALALTAVLLKTGATP